MATSAIIEFIRKSKTNALIEEPLVKLYIDHDEFVDHLGVKIGRWLCKKKLANGYCEEYTRNKWDNIVDGSYHLVSKFIRDFEKEGVDVVPLNFSRRWVDYIYEIYIFDDFNLSAGMNVRDCKDFDNVQIIIKRGLKIEDEETRMIFHGDPVQLASYENYANKDDIEECDDLLSEKEKKCMKIIIKEVSEEIIKKIDQL